MLVVLVCLVFVCECFGKDSWDGTFQSRRFSQKFRVRESIITAETEVIGTFFFFFFFLKKKKLIER